MSAERFFDDLARTLAEPMPRRRAVRVIGVSIAAVAVPGMRPRLGRAASTLQADKCPEGSGRRQCWTAPDWVPGRPDPQPYCCNYPEQQWVCGDKANGYKCRDTCPPRNPLTGDKQEPTWSSAKFPGGRPQRYNCCIRPDTIPREGDCLPNCRLPINGNGVLCGRTCCPPGQRCKRPSTGECVPCPRRQEACGRTCCKSGQRCRPCFERANDYSSSSIEQNGREKCCGPNEKCCRDTCCKFETTCCGGQCCASDTACAARRGRYVCCSTARTVLIDDHAFCCPIGTVPVRRKGCCPPGDPNCCPPTDNLGGVLNCAGRGQICVNGNCVNP